MKRVIISILLATLMLVGCAPNPATYRSCEKRRLPVEVVVLSSGRPSGKQIRGMRAYYWEGRALDYVIAGDYELLSFEFEPPVVGDTICMEFEEFGSAVERARNHMETYYKKSWHSKM